MGEVYKTQWCGELCSQSTQRDRRHAICCFFFVFFFTCLEEFICSIHSKMKLALVMTLANIVTFFKAGDWFCALG